MTEHHLAEHPTLRTLEALGYAYLPPAEAAAQRDGPNHVLLRSSLVKSIQRINQVSNDVAQAVYAELQGINDNERWLQLLRGNYSRSVPGESKHQTIQLIDFLDPGDNTLTVTNQLKVQGEAGRSRIADVVVYVNGIPLVVIEAKSPLAMKDKTGEAFEQIRQYEREIPRLFYTNAFNVVTNGVRTLYGATGAASDYWSEWKDPWPRTVGDFGSRLEQDLWALLEPSRLLDLVAHFIVFERRDDGVTKKICRYQQFRAVNKIVRRVVEEEHRRGLIWHTQGSGKSLTMVFAALKLKSHRTLASPALESPNLLVLTDRIDLDDQISETFEACGLPNPVQVDSASSLHEQLRGQATGLTLLSTIFKFQGSTRPVPGSGNWILLVDECHRTQEQDLGAYLRATFPEAHFFGFTGTPIKTTDKDTYANFGAPGEGYLDRYGIDDAVADGATVPIYYLGRKTEWQVDEARLDILFDQWFAGASESVVAAIKERGVRVADLARHPRRVELIAYDIWTHFQEHALPDGFKAQVVAIDREAVVLYKRALDRVIAEDLMRRGVSEAEAWERAAAMSVCVYSPSQEDAKPSEDEHVASIRRDLVRWALDRQGEAAVKSAFLKPGPPYFLIVCNKLLTGFDAPIEKVMYLDSPLKEHNLLQAIARTNRVAGPHKTHGLVVDYIGVSRKLDEALASYRQADVKNAMRDVEALRSALRAAHAEVMALCRGVRRRASSGAGSWREHLKAEYDALVQRLGTEDAWLTFRRKARAFVAAYSALSPDPAVLEYREDLKWVAGFITYGTLHFEKRESIELGGYSAKIRRMLEEHLEATGLSTVVKLRNLTDPEFWRGFERPSDADELRTAAIRKSAELKKITAERVTENPLRWGPFSERVREAIRRFEQGQLEAAELLAEMERVATELREEDAAHAASGLPEGAYGIYRILEAFGPVRTFMERGPEYAAEPRPAGGTARAGEDSPTTSSTPHSPSLHHLALALHDLYASDRTAPPGWHLKEQLRKELRQQVREAVFPYGLEGWKREIPARVEEYALRVYLKG